MRVLLLLALVPAPAFACAMPYRPPPEKLVEAPKPVDPAAVQAAQAEQLKAIMAEIDAAFVQPAPPAPATVIPEAQAKPSS